MSSEITYRLVEQKDNQALAKMIRGVLEEFGVNQPGTVYFDSSTDSLYELFSAEENAIYFIAEKQGELIGACGLYPTKGLPEGCIELVKFYLKKEFRGLGIGKHLMELSLEQAKKWNFKSVYLESLPELNTAVGMYEKAGFRHIPERLGESGHFACNIIMLKEF